MLDLTYTDRRTGASYDALPQLLTQRSLWVGDRSISYPDHPLWVDKAISEWENVQKQVIFAFMGTVGVGSIMYQRLPTNPSFLEIKNLSLEPSGRGRHVAATLLRLAEIEGTKDFPGVHTVIGDIKANKKGLIGLVEMHGYSIGAPENIMATFAHNGMPDVRVTKSLLRAPSLRDM